MNTKQQIQQHIKTHSKCSAEDAAAVAMLETFLRSDGKINCNFASNDKWPNTDGTFEFVSNPIFSRKPEQNFVVQIKGTHGVSVCDEGVKYSLKSLGFPAHIYSEVTSDPGILFVVVNPDDRGNERVFWKYMSESFLSSINYENESTTIIFHNDEEIENTNDSVNEFCEKLEKISKHHSFAKKLNNQEYGVNDLIKIINKSNEFISESLDSLEIYNKTRDNISEKILSRLYDLCSSTLLLNAIKLGKTNPNLRLAWELSLLSIETKYLGTFLKGLSYIGNRIPDEGQSERLMLKYYDFLWQIRKYLSETHNISILKNLEKFPRKTDESDNEYYSLVSQSIENFSSTPSSVSINRYFVQKKTSFYIGNKRYFELTLQLANRFANKYNRITVYSKENISTGYSVNISYKEIPIKLFDIVTTIKYITYWKVSIPATCLNKISKIIGTNLSLSAKYGEYSSLMNFLTKTGLNLLDLLDIGDDLFSKALDDIYKDTNTQHFKEVLHTLKINYSIESKAEDKNTIRYLLIHLNEDDFYKVMPNKFQLKTLRNNKYLSSKCYPFEKKPFISNLVGSKTNSNNNLRQLIEVAGNEEYKKMLPYIHIEQLIKSTGNIYFEEDDVLCSESITSFNNDLDSWEKTQGYKLLEENNFFFIESYEKTTLNILNKLLGLSKCHNKGQREYNKKFLKEMSSKSIDEIKAVAIENVFVDSNILLIYGAAGTGKTTLINYISNLMSNQKKLFLTKTHAAKQNLIRRIDNPGADSEFISIDKFSKRAVLSEYDVVFVDECSTIDNKTMETFLSRLGSDAMVVLAGDIYQIESINFGNWFYYAKNIIKNSGSNIELLNTWRTEDENLISLWDSVRNKSDIVVEKLAIDGPYSENIGPSIFKKDFDDEIVLCLNYDGKFGLNNINLFFQNANENDAVIWQDWIFKKGDHILFNDTERFSVLHNNLKGKIFDVKLVADGIVFTIDVSTSLTERICQREDIDFVEAFEDFTRVAFKVYKYNDDVDEIDGEFDSENTIIPFQLAYAVSIHKSQGLEYDSVKIVIPNNNSERITHSVFYTAITRAKKKLKIYWSSETMKDVVANLDANISKIENLEIVKRKLRE